MQHDLTHPSRGRLIAVALLGWLSMLGVDFLLHAGILADLYQEPSSFLLPPLEAFRRIPLGYLAFLLSAVFLLWLFLRLEIRGLQNGFWLGIRIGGYLWGTLALGLFSISTASPTLLFGWFFGQAIEMGVGGAVMGVGLTEVRLRRLALLVVLLVFLLFIAGVVLQNL